MPDQAELQLSLRLVPADDQPADPLVLDDIIRLVRQAIATAPRETPTVHEPEGGFREPTEEQDKRALRSLHSKIENRIQEASAASQSEIAKRAEIASQPDGADKLARQSLQAAERLVPAVQRAMLRRVAVRIPEAETQPSHKSPNGSSGGSS